MNRIVLLAAAAALIAAPASAQSIRIATAGKSVEKLHGEILKAASTLCARQTYGATFPIDAQRSCIKQTVRATVAQAAIPALAAIQPTRFALR
ncbi:hypothetical protein [Phenylobacterium sp.]|uniref:hypothetical protein n=1 Tax=Phenylobacterium sp. TaxID=1871053 RepID=UPI003982FCB6